MSSLAKNYNRRKISFKKGKGSFLYSTNGKKYLDFVQGIAVNSLGHSNPYLNKAMILSKIILSKFLNLRDHSSTKHHEASLLIKTAAPKYIVYTFLQIHFNHFVSLIKHNKIGLV